MYKEELASGLEALAHVSKEELAFGLDGFAHFSNAFLSLAPGITKVVLFLNLGFAVKISPGQSARLANARNAGGISNASATSASVSLSSSVSYT